MIAAVALVTESAAASNRSQSLSTIETWLEELIRRFGTLEAAIHGIADGSVQHQLVRADHAHALLALWSSESTDEAIRDDARVESLVLYVTEWLAEQGQKQIEQLERQSMTLAEIQSSQSRIERSQDKLLNEIRAGQGRSKDDQLSDAALAARALDDRDNARLRSDRLRDLLDALDGQSAQPFAARSRRWLLARSMSTAAACDLLQPLLDEAVWRFKESTLTDRADSRRVLEELRALGVRLLEDLDGEESLKLSSQIAYVDHVLEGARSGLRRLEGRSDPWAVRRRLGILIDEDRYAEAADLVRGATPRPEWIEKAIGPLVMNGEEDQARRLVDWCVAEHLPSRVIRIVRRLFAASVLVALEEVEDPSDEQTNMLATARNILKPLAEEVLSRGSPERPVDVQILQIELELACRLKDSAALQLAASVLEKWVPLELRLAQLAHQGLIDSHTDWPQRIRAEHTTSFDTALLAVALEARDQSRLAAAFRSGLNLVTQANTNEQRRNLHAVLAQAVQYLGDEELGRFEEIAPSLLDPTDRQSQLWEAARLIRAEQFEKAQQLITALRDENDALWLQINGNLLLSVKETREGIEAITRAALLVRRPDLLADTLGVAVAHGQWVQAEQLLSALIVVRPGDVQILEDRAHVLYQLGRYEDAATILQELAKQIPEEPSHGINAAQAHVLAGQPDRAIPLLQSVCESDEPPLRAVLDLALIHSERGSPDEALALLEENRGRFWRDYEFVGLYWSTAYAAEAEDKGHAAFIQLRLLQHSGEAPAEVLVAKSVDDVLEMGRKQEEQHKQQASLLLRGQLPWLLVAQARREAVLQFWTSRTAERRWILEDDTVLADSAVYATHGFAVAMDAEVPELLPICGSDVPGPVVADLTALVTLSELNLLEQVAHACRELHIPGEYMFKMFIDSSAMRPHQPSRQTALQNLRQKLATERLFVRQPDGTAVPVVDEHHPEPEPPGTYHLADVGESLRRSGALTTEAAQRLSSVSHRPLRVDQPELQKGQWVRVGLSTLASLYQCALLDIVLRHFNVCLGPDDESVIHQEILWHDKHAQIRDRHATLWQFMRDSPAIHRHTRDEHPPQNDDDGVDNELCLRSLALARSLRLPLLVDDRAVQAVAINERAGQSGAAFASCHLLRTLFDAGAISIESYAAAIMQMMEWRYRFILPDLDLLLHWAAMSAAGPGPNLVAVSRYVHSAVRDPGLFCGVEPTTPPTTLALKYWQVCETVAGDFVGELWRNESFSDTAADELTRWAVVHLLPPVPKTMDQLARPLSDWQHPLFLCSATWRVSTCQDTDRARRGFESVREALGVGSMEMQKQLSRVIDECLN